MQSVYTRIALYVLSPVIAALVAALPGLGIAFEDGVVMIDLATLVAAIVAALGLSGAVFAKWGVK